MVVVRLVSPGRPDHSLQADPATNIGQLKQRAGLKGEALVLCGQLLLDQVQLEQLLVPGQGVELSLEVWPAVDWRSALQEAWLRREGARASAAQQTAGIEQAAMEALHYQHLALHHAATNLLSPARQIDQVEQGRDEQEEQEGRGGEEQEERGGQELEGGAGRGREELHRGVGARLAMVALRLGLMLGLVCYYSSPARVLLVCLMFWLLHLLPVLRDQLPQPSHQESRLATILTGASNFVILFFTSLMPDPQQLV